MGFIQKAIQKTRKIHHKAYHYHALSLYPETQIQHVRGSNREFSKYFEIYADRQTGTPVEVPPVLKKRISETKSEGNLPGVKLYILYHVIPSTKKTQIESQSNSCIKKELIFTTMYIHLEATQIQIKI